MLATRIKRQIAAGGSGRSGLGKSQSGEQQRGDREGDQERFTPPPPDRVSAAAARRARWAAVRRLAVWFTVVTLHQRRAFVIAAASAGMGSRFARVGSCLRRNDGRGAGMTVVGVGAIGVNRLYAPGGGAIW